jgi:CheY-like chemotaxis protein
MANVLVVDDDKDFLKIAQRFLQAAGYSVVTATDAVGGIEALGRELFDLILTDANMPGGSGFDLVKTLKRNDQTKGLPVAMLTGRRDKEDIDKGLSCGADDYIVKPIDPDIFLSKVDSLIKQKPQDRAEISFAESPVRMSADWKVKSEITSISEQGLTLWSPISAQVNAKFKVNSDIFAEIGIEPPAMRVVNCKADPTNLHMHFTEVSFVGMTDAERQKIRFWVHSNTKLGKGKAA